MTDLARILRQHEQWLQNPADGTRADLCGADLCNADLRGADLRSADLRGADLRIAVLRIADLCGADLRGADLRGADLRGADLRGADLRIAVLRGADLCGADLRGADLDFSCWPLWCGTINVQLDERLARQLLAHVFVVTRDMLPWTDELRAEAAKSHRAKELGITEPPND